LIYTITLATNTKFHRYIAASTDPRYNTTAGTLSANTYLSPLLDDTYLNSGFAVVGRLALPIPLPATFKFVYEISAGATIQVGTVSPAFGQAGGGVEVRLTATTAARQLSLPQLPEA
jgi:hypothetical protein